MVKLIHGADLHLDSPFSGLSPELAAQRRKEQRQLLESLAELARAREVDGVLLSGDLLDGAVTFRETAEALSAQLGAAGCPVFIAPGNHDPYDDRSPYVTLKWPDNVHIFSTATVEGVELPEKNCVIHGAAFPERHLTRSPLEDFTAPKDGKLHIMALHGQVGSEGDYGPISSQAISNSGLDYLALGHVHQYSGLQKEGNTFWAYPGCPQGRGFDELGDKGVVYLEIDKGVCRAEFIPLSKRRYQVLEVDLTDRDDHLTAIRAALPADTQHDIYRILLTGFRSGNLDLPKLERELSLLFFALTIRDRTKLPRQLWARMEEDTLTGLFLREMAHRCQEDPDNDTLQMAVRYGLAALEGGEDPAP